MFIMTRKRVAVIGAGVVGVSAAYYLSKDESIDLTIFDDGIGQGTSAAAGIISPWLSRRRNKKWYHMVKEGAAFYPDFLSDVMNGDTIPPSVYKQVGTLVFKTNDQYLDDLLDIGEKRRENAPEIGELKILPPEKVREKVPIYTKESPALWASGGARVDGKKLVELVLEEASKNGASLVKERVTLSQSEEGYVVHTSTGPLLFDSVVLAAAAWLPELLGPLDYEVDSRPQKGQLVEVKLAGYNTNDWPVIMPEGEEDIIPFENGHVIIGATHENEEGFNLDIDENRLKDMIVIAADKFSDTLKTASIESYRSGTRAYTSDFSPFFGPVPGHQQLFAASGLGSTGLTAGPLVGKCLAQLVMEETPDLPLADYPIEQYVKQTNEPPSF